MGHSDHERVVALGAEARIIQKDDEIIKDRIAKTYRHPQIDLRLRTSRTRREIKVLRKLASLKFPAPRVVATDETSFSMQRVHGDKIRDVLSDIDHIKACEKIGRLIAILHNHMIIHGDLTTSNMILADADAKVSKGSSYEIYLIDFGLSFFSTKEEDMAVDLHLLRRALESKHHQIWYGCFNAVIKAYSRYATKAALVLSRLEKVEKRGRNKKG